jgi:hypothetical protein
MPCLGSSKFSRGGTVTAASKATIEEDTRKE